MLSLNSPITELPRVGYKKALSFKKLGITTIAELLYYSPRDYIDYSQIQTIDQLEPGKVSFKAGLAGAPRVWHKGQRHITQVVLEDETGQILAYFFNQPYRARQLKLGREYMVSGELSFSGSNYSLVHPSVEPIERDRLSTGMIVARYGQTKGLDSRAIRLTQQTALKLLDKQIEIYPDKFVAQQKLLPLFRALSDLHFPKNDQDSQAALNRLSFDEMFSLVLAGQLTKKQLSISQSQAINFDETLAKGFIKSLDFTLTDAQKRSAWEILQDIDSTKPMNRMLEGDVGSGKTVVVAMALLMSSYAGVQSAILAPTTILSSQHFSTLKKLFKPFDINLELLNRHTKASNRSDILKRIESGKIDVLVGTQALLSQKINFKQLGLVVVDEQHRFGVEQRSMLSNKNDQLMPHVLTMTATPIPRSLALTLYGELDLSIIDEMPKGRKPIKTELFGYGARAKVYKAVVEELDKGNQAYIVTPRIEDKNDDITSLNKLVADLEQGELKGRKVLSLHGKMKLEEKDAIMEQFYSGKTEALISTSVVEVGLDNPNATIMVVEGAERFGLAQLHQLRGRVGRSDKQSQCILVTSPGFAPSRRLNAMVISSDGFSLAKLDLKLRGPGALYGTRQHGILDLNLADISDVGLINKAKKAVDEFLAQNYDLNQYDWLSARVDKIAKPNFLN